MPVFGPFAVGMQVCDGSGAEITHVGAATVGPRHVVQVHNFSTLPYGVRVEVSLPNGAIRLAFVTSGGLKPGWDAASYDIPGKTTAELECPMRHMTGTAHAAEPLQCERVFKNKGRLPFNLIHNPPFRIHVAVS